MQAQQRDAQGAAPEASNGSVVTTTTSTSDPQSVQQQERRDSADDEALEAMCARLVIDNDDDDFGPLTISPSTRGNAGPNGNASSSGFLQQPTLMSAGTNASSSAGGFGVAPPSASGSTKATPTAAERPKEDLFQLVINPDPALLPTFNSSKCVEDILLDQARYGAIVKATSYKDVNAWYARNRPANIPRGPHQHQQWSGVPQTAQAFIGQLPGFATEEFLTMCLEYVHGVPGSVYYSLIRRENSGTHAAYALATLGSDDHVPTLLALSRHVFLGKAHVFYTDVRQGAVQEFQRIVARVMAIDASRPNPEQMSVGYARACLVIATANPPGRRESRRGAARERQMQAAAAADPWRRASLSTPTAAQQHAPPPPPPPYSAAAGSAQQRPGDGTPSASNGRGGVSPPLSAGASAGPTKAVFGVSPFGMFGSTDGGANGASVSGGTSPQGAGPSAFGAAKGGSPVPGPVAGPFESRDASPSVTPGATPKAGEGQMQLYARQPDGSFVPVGTAPVVALTPANAFPLPPNGAQQQQQQHQQQQQQHQQQQYPQQQQHQPQPQQVQFQQFAPAPAYPGAPGFQQRSQRSPMARDGPAKRRGGRGNRGNNHNGPYGQKWPQQMPPNAQWAVPAPGGQPMPPAAGHHMNANAAPWPVSP